MAQWVATANSRGAKYIQDPRADDVVRAAQLALQARAQREADAMQARRIAEEARQYDQDLLFRRDAMAQQQLQAQAGMQSEAWQRDFAERNAARQVEEQRARAQADAEDRLFRRNEAARQASLAERRYGLDEREFNARGETERQRAQREEQEKRDALARADRLRREQWAREERLAAEERGREPGRRKAEEESRIRVAREAGADSLTLRQEKARIDQERAEAAEQERAQIEADRRAQIRAALEQKAQGVAAYGGDLFRRQLDKTGVTDNWYRDLNLGIFPWERPDKGRILTKDELRARIENRDGWLV